MMSKKESKLLPGEQRSNGHEEKMGAPVVDQQKVFWHRELPPLDATPLGEFSVEGASPHIPGTIAHRDELWARCYDDGMALLRARLEEEIRRRRGDYAHVLAESVDSKHDPVKNETWLQIRLTCMLYARTSK